MAKGNDGNFLQHAIETSAARALEAQASGLHVALTHGMKPRESCGAAGGVRRMRLDGALGRARRSATAPEHPLVTAYRATNASRESYPNSAELLAAMAGRDNFSGVIIEKNKDNFGELDEHWDGHPLKVLWGSWRKYSRELSSPPQLNVPWLFSMDPYTYRDTVQVDDANLYPSDFTTTLQQVLRTYAAGDRPGAATIFVYCVEPNVETAFRSRAKELAEAVGLQQRIFGLTHKAGFRNVGAVLAHSDVLDRITMDHPRPSQTIGTILDSA